MNRRIPNGTYGGVRGRELIAPSYSISDATDSLYGTIQFTGFWQLWQHLDFCVKKQIKHIVFIGIISYNKCKLIIKEGDT